MELSLNILESQKLLRFLLVEVEDDEVVEYGLIVVLYDEFSVHQFGKDRVSLVDLAIQELTVSNDRLGQ